MSRMLVIRLQRVGKRNEPTYRLVLTDSKNGPKSGRFLKVLGSYDPRDKNETILKAEEIQEAIAQGAQVSDTVNNLLINKGVIKGEKINVLPKKTPIIKEEEEKPEEAAAPEATEAPAEEVAPVEEVKEDAPAEEVKEEAPTEEPKEEEKPTE